MKQSRFAAEGFVFTTGEGASGRSQPYGCLLPPSTVTQNSDGLEMSRIPSGKAVQLQWPCEPSFTRGVRAWDADITV